MPSLPPRLPRKRSNTAFLISILLHVGIGLALFFLAARQGVLGKRMKEITAVVVPEEKKPEPKKPEEPKPEIAKTPEPARNDPPKTAVAPPPVAQTAPPPVDTATAVAPPPSIGADFDFNDGAKAVQTTSDPKELFRSVVEYAFRSRWVKPDDINDTDFVAEVEEAIDPEGKVLSADWKKGSGDPRWDASVKQALGGTRHVGRPPPKGFPGRFLVRFDAIPDTAPIP